MQQEPGNSHWDGGNGAGMAPRRSFAAHSHQSFSSCSILLAENGSVCSSDKSHLGCLLPGCSIGMWHWRSSSLCSLWRCPSLLWLPKSVLCSFVPAPKQHLESRFHYSAFLIISGLFIYFFLKKFVFFCFVPCSSWGR